MNRATVGSLLVVGGTILVLVSAKSAAAIAPADSVAHSTQDDEGPSPRVSAHLDLGGSAQPGSIAATAVNAGIRPTAPNAQAMLTGAGSCPEGMVEVDGDYCPALEQKCLRWLDPQTATPRRCAEFAQTGSCQTKTRKKHFCIDRFEYPNKAGDKPVVMKTWYEAVDTCRAQGKRLCGDSEWTLACEGQEHLPYPYGYTRNADACNIDKPHPDANEKALANPVTRGAEVERLWQGEVSGARESCVSPYGAFDMTGNVDEWVVNESGVPYKSGLKGGYWGPVRDRCRPMTTAHYESFAFYQIGFRCCSDPGADGAAKPARPAVGTSGKAPSTNPAPTTIAGS
ncbi:MAG: formylglycine-generating enzyme family protein [Polyangiaceae bacterium]|nr:formylglycine-generating enzyme family protein [Polyangiaceae bacterium]